MGKFDVLIYEVAVLILASSLFYMSFTMRKLMKIIKKPGIIWALPFVSAAVLLVSLGMHAYASFKLIPGIEKLIGMLSEDEVLFNAEKLAAVKQSIGAGKEAVLKIKALSFTCFAVSAVFLLAVNTVYIKWISR